MNGSRRSKRIQDPLRPAADSEVSAPGTSTTSEARFRGGGPASATRAWPAGRHRQPMAILGMAAAVGLGAPLVVALGLPGSVRFPLVAAFFCIVPGTALLSVLRGRPEPGLILATSLATTAVVAQVMLWLRLWRPEIFFYLFAVVCVTPLVAQLRSSSSTWASIGAASAWLKNLRRELAAWASADTVAHLGIIVFALVMWGISLTRVDLGRIAGLGLVNALPPTYFVAFGLLLVGFALAVTQRPFEVKLAFLYVLALILVVHGTTPLLYAEPRYIWVYKHFGVINVIAATGRADRALDIYNNWPGFFAANAWLTRLTGLAPASYAPWAQVFFNLANVAALQFALRGLTSNRRVLWTATWVFVLANWVGQDYLAPQAFAFFLSTVVIGLCLRCARPRPIDEVVPGQQDGVPLGGDPEFMRAPSRHAARARLLRLLREDLPQQAPLPLLPVGAVVIGGLCYFALLTSHQLTPVVVIASVTALMLTTGGIRWWVPTAMVVLEVCWVALAWSYLRDNFALFDPNPSESTAPRLHAGHQLPGLTTVIHAAWALVVLVLIGAALGLILRYRTGRHYVAVSSLIAAPLVVVGFQSYGGEGRYRLFLFALPWLSFFFATALELLVLGRDSRLVGRVALAIVSVSLATGLLLAYFGLELINRVSRGDVAAAVWFEEHAPPRSLLVVPATNNVSRLTANYPRVYRTLNRLVLTDLAAYRRGVVGPHDLPGLEATLRAYGGSKTFLMISQSEANFARLYGTLPADWRQSLEQSLRASRKFRLVYRRENSEIFEYGAGRGHG